MVIYIYFEKIKFGTIVAFSLSPITDMEVL